MAAQHEKIQPGIYKKGEISLESIIAQFKHETAINEVGSILTFSGIVRATSMDKRDVNGMKIDAYDELANKSLISICENIKARDGIIDIIIVHFKGEFDVSDDLVHVIVASSHRDEGFKALRDAVERYKKEVAVWKKEIFSDGTSKWVH